ncbi:DUF5788 family protein [Halocatena marina]|uniref:DUF5788 family protein n=1 Tax=Halocatena marina TaxID=2934937 RepID=A0ABD5YY55_9EURY|nr:DUF5788 family protein [Halocatena marina]
MKEYERKQLLERIDREGATVGSSIPETIDVQGEEINLRAFVFETKRRATVPPGEQDRLDRVKRNLRRERLQRRQRIEDDAVTFETGKQLVESIIGIERALSALDSLERPDIEREIEAKEAADTKRWTKFLKQVLGSDTNTPRRNR